MNRAAGEGQHNCCLVKTTALNILHKLSELPHLTNPTDIVDRRTKYYSQASNLPVTITQWSRLRPHCKEREEGGARQVSGRGSSDATQAPAPSRDLLGGRGAEPQRVRGHLLSSASSATAGSCQELNCGGRWRECAHAELRGPGWAAALAVSRDQQRGLGRLALGRVRSWVPPRRPGPGGRYLFPVGLGVQPRGPRRASHRLLFLGCPLPWRIQILPESFPTLAGIARSPGPASRPWTVILLYTLSASCVSVMTDACHHVQLLLVEMRSSIVLPQMVLNCDPPNDCLSGR
ncbi:uncharacterized protein [Castor canadensis]|uniref:Uncharacterized protein n=1 Tax=Castor canadensis TaxID=51338 RepID=A0AC58LU96_CASCN